MKHFNPSVPPTEDEAFAQGMELLKQVCAAASDPPLDDETREEWNKIYRVCCPGGGAPLE